MEPVKEDGPNQDPAVQFRVSGWEGSFFLVLKANYRWTHVFILFAIGSIRAWDEAIHFRSLAELFS